MTGYELSRQWFDWGFENPEKINIEEILKCKPSSLRDYSNGGFYLINTEFGLYIGKSIDYMYRLRSHLQKSSNKTTIDRLLNHCNNIDTYLLLTYKEAGVNFFNRELEIIIEQTFVSIAHSHNYNVLNERIYGHLQII